MDPVSSLSLACNILQLVEFSSKIIVGAADLYHEGASQENAELKDITGSLIRYTSAVKTASSRGQHETELQDIAGKAENVATELATLLGTLEVPKNAEHRIWKSVRVTVRGMYKKDKVKSLESRLQSLQSLLNTWMIRPTRDETSIVSRQVEDLVQKHKDLGAETSRSFQEMRRMLLEIQRLANENQEERREKNAKGAAEGLAKQEITLQEVREVTMKGDMRFWPEIYKQLSFAADEVKLISKSQQLLRSLYDPDLVLRYISVEEEYADMFRWIFDDPTHGFKDWLETGHGTYWISGKPGAEKATLMKMM